MWASVVSAEEKPVEFAEDQAAVSAEDKAGVSAKRDLWPAKRSQWHGFVLCKLDRFLFCRQSTCPGSEIPPDVGIFARSATRDAPW